MGGQVLAGATSGTSPHTPEHWRSALVRQMEALGPSVQGRLITDSDPAQELVPATDFLREDYLEPAILRVISTEDEQPSSSGDNGGTQAVSTKYRQIAASRFARHYAGSLTLVALSALARGIGLDLSAERCKIGYWRTVPFRVSLDLDDSQVLECAERPSTWSGAGRSVSSVRELRDHVWETLYARNIGPLIAKVGKLVVMPEGLLWTNAAEWVGTLHDESRLYLGREEATPFVDECRTLLDADRLPGLQTEANPLHGRLDWTANPDDASEEIAIRRLCCLSYLLDDRGGRLCGGCPYLPVPEQFALFQERKGLAVGERSGGPAEQRAIRRGLDRASSRANKSRRASQ